MKPTKRIEAHQIPELRERATTKALHDVIVRGAWEARERPMGVHLPPTPYMLDRGERAPRPFPWLEFTVSVAAVVIYTLTLIGAVTVVRWVGRVW